MISSLYETSWHAWCLRDRQQVENWVPNKNCVNCIFLLTNQRSLMTLWKPWTSPEYSPVPPAPAETLRRAEIPARRSPFVSSAVA